jgi:hypothetical protein
VKRGGDFGPWRRGSSVRRTYKWKRNNVKAVRPVKPVINPVRAVNKRKRLMLRRD